MNCDTKAFDGYKKDLKKALTAAEPSAQVKALINLHADRITDGVDRGIASSRAYYAIDRAYDISQHQISPTLMRDLIDRNPNVQEVESLTKAWGLESMLTPVADASIYSKKKGGDPNEFTLIQSYHEGQGEYAGHLRTKKIAWKEF
jgi:hypothetical protein